MKGLWREIDLNNDYKNEQESELQFSGILSNQKSVIDSYNEQSSIAKMTEGLLNNSNFNSI